MKNNFKIILVQDIKIIHNKIDMNKMKQTIFIMRNKIKFTIKK